MSIKPSQRDSAPHLLRGATARERRTRERRSRALPQNATVAPRRYSSGVRRRGHWSTGPPSREERSGAVGGKASMAGRPSPDHASWNWLHLRREGGGYNRDRDRLEPNPQNQKHDTFHVIT